MVEKIAFPRKRISKKRGRKQFQGTDLGVMEFYYRGNYEKMIFLVNLCKTLAKS